MRPAPAIGFALAVLVADSGTAESPATALQLPHTISRVWYTSTRKGPGKLFNLAGDLTISAASLELETRKQRVTIPVAEIHGLWFGKMKGDVDTDWAVLRVGKPDQTYLVAFRDGSQMGFGTRTAEIHGTLRRALRQLGAAQYSAPAGFRVYDRIDEQVTFALPVDWTAYVQDIVVTQGGKMPWGTLLFSPTPLRRLDRAAEDTPGVAEDAQAVAKALDGTTPAFSLERRPATRGMACDGLSAGARDTLAGQSAADPLFAGGTIESRTAEPSAAGECQGLRLRTSGRRSDGVQVELETLAVAHRDTLFLFSLREPGDAAAERTGRAAFDKALSTLRFSDAR